MEMETTHAPVRPWRAAPMRELEGGAMERFCRICKRWYGLDQYRAYGRGSYCAICQSCERAARRMRYLRDQRKEQERARNWGRLKRAQVKQAVADAAPVIPADAPPVEPVAMVGTEGVVNETAGVTIGALGSA